jgi:hypothetical protein
MNGKGVFVNWKCRGLDALSSALLGRFFNELQVVASGFHVHKSALDESVSTGTRVEPGG